MFIAKVIGNVVSTVKNEDITGAKLLVVQPMGKGQEAAIIAVDCIGAGTGETVMVVHEGGSSRMCYNKPRNKPNAPVDAVIVGIVDGMNIIES